MSTATPSNPYAVHATAIRNAHYHLEVIDGVPCEKPLPKHLHALIQKRITALLSAHFPSDFVLNELDVLLGNGDWLVPDVVVVDDQARYEQGMLATAPLLAVEILSPGQTRSNMFSKCERLLAAGTPICWILDPKNQLAWRYTQDDLREVSDTLSLFSTVNISVRNLFQDLPDSI